MTDYPFPQGLTFDKYIGNNIQINGSNFTITDVPSETTQPSFNERWGVFEARSHRTGGTVALKMRYQLSPSDLRVSSERSGREFMAYRSFETEWNALRDCQGHLSLPDFLRHGELVQDRADPFPGGYIRVIVMAKVPGESVIEIFNQLTAEKKADIRTKVTAALEHMRLQGYVFFEPETEQIFFDQFTSQVYLVGLSRADRERFPLERGEVITETSIDMIAFGMGWGPV